ncbi:UDP-N-acetylmuramoyl-tripeptide--D-alanyl-D-alanine ligase [Clostridium sp. BJN0001]|uniref:UDP-N-acetylmuramoyl-tripeptide--D-alanyl-D- alanine ligase n=1 Tax=Clostridium sp. BJN0001 TaxID=2930219 RepID=UPI001FD3A8D0|nr:UDP-N-acetylmuramoyl-tripeptide--D-alanyl-D-alanine ligase [Clostridium sp. BJN0001]
MKLELSEVVKAVTGEVVYKNNDGKFNKVSTDTRKITNGDMFIALRGKNFNGNDYIDKAIELGASVVIADEVKPNIKGEATIIKVKDTKKALGDLAKFYRQTLNIKVVSVTGSAGKTSTKDLTAALLSGKFKVFKTEENFNNDIGLPLMILKLDDSYDVAVLEMGTNNFGEITYLSNIARPDIGLMTNIGVAHIEYFKTRENILKEKLSIADYFEKENILIVNGENDLLSQIKDNKKYKLEKVGYNKLYDIHAESIELNSDNTNFTVVSKDNSKHRFTLPLVGEHNVLNALLGIEACLDLGMTFEEMEKGLSNFKNSKMRLEIIEKNGYTIINDSYNANPDSMKVALNVLKEYKGKRKIAVLGTMGELGDFSIKSHKEVAEFANNICDALYTTGEYSNQYKEGFKENTFIYKDRNELVKNLQENLEEGDVVLVKASFSQKFREIVSYLKNN